MYAIQVSRYPNKPTADGAGNWWGIQIFINQIIVTADRYRSTLRKLRAEYPKNEGYTIGGCKYIQ